MESRGISGVDMELILRGSLRDGLLSNSDLFNGHSWDSDSSVRRVDGHGVKSFHGDLFSLVFSSDHFVSGDLSFGSVFLEDSGGFSG
jgi:hypothetical protein